MAIDRDFFEGYDGNLSRSKITKLRKEAGAYSTGTFFEELKQEFQEKGFKDLKFKVIDAEDSDQDPRVIEIYYANIIPPSSEYMLPRVQIEIGCRSLREPYSIKSFGALVDEVYADKDFAEALFNVPTVNPERTFLDKLFLLHEEFHRPAKKKRVDRLSRHMYDIYYLTQTGVAANAMNDKKLYETIVAHRHKFSKVGGVDYNNLNPKTVSPIPVSEVTDYWRKDYIKMTEEMIYEENAPGFDQLIDNLNELRIKLQNLKWDFELKFPQPNYQ